MHLFNLRGGLIAAAFLAGSLLSLTLVPGAFAADPPKLVEKDGRYALMVDGRPYLISGRSNSQLQRVAQRVATGMGVDGRAACKHRGSSSLLGAA
jgi:hypothetical protein